MATQLETQALCRVTGEHRPRRVPVRNVVSPLRTTCRDCGCVLVRTLASRRWFYSGPLA